MRTNRLISGGAKVVILLALIWTLWHLEHRSFTSSMAAPDDDDINVMSRVPVHLGNIRRATLHRYLTFYGTVEADIAHPHDAAHPTTAPAGQTVSLPMAALVQSVNVSEGARVDLGQLLFTLDPRALDAESETARQQLESAAGQLQRMRQLASSARPDPVAEALAQQQVLIASSRVQTAAAARAMLQVHAALRGTVVRLAVRPGEAIQPNTVALELVDLDRRVISLQVSADQSRLLAVGLPCEILDSREATTAPSEVSSSSVTSPTNIGFIDTAADPQNGLVGVDVPIPLASSLKLGQAVAVRVAVETHPHCLAVPVDAVVNDASGRPGISIPAQDFRWALRQPVHIGLKEGNLVELVDPNLAEGQDIVTVGAYTLPDKSRIEVDR